MRPLFLSLALLAAAYPSQIRIPGPGGPISAGGGSITLLASQTCGNTTGSAGGVCTTPSITWTGKATFVCVGVTGYISSGLGFSGIVVSDSVSDSYHIQDQVVNSSTDAATTIYCSSASLGGTFAPVSGVTITANYSSSYLSAFVEIFGNSAGVIDQQNNTGNQTSSSTVQPGSVSPSTTGQVIIALVGSYAYGLTSLLPDSGFTVPANNTQTGVTGQNLAGAMAYLIQSVAAPVDPIWTQVGGSSNPGQMTSTILTAK
jgi:hypothetical protein